MATEVGTKGKVVQVLGAVVDVEFPPIKYRKSITKFVFALRTPITTLFLKLSNCWATTGFVAWQWVPPMASSAA